MARLLNHLTRRAPLFVSAALLGIAVAGVRTRASTHDQEGVRAAVARATEMDVEAIFWEPSRGIVLDYLMGRPLLFEGREKNAGATTSNQAIPRDIHRAFLRVSPEGSVLSASTSTNLTRTRRGDESGLSGRGQLALFASSPSGAPASIGLLDLNGEKTTPHLNPLDRLQLGLTRLIDTGTWSGIARSDLLVQKPGSELSVELKETELSIRVGDFSTSHSVAHFFSQKKAGNLSNSSTEFRFVVRGREPISWVHWGANTGRHLFGNDFIAWAEGRLFTALDRFHQVGSSVETSPGETSPPPAKLISQSSTPARERGPIWPPAAIVVPGRAQDGKWRAVENTILTKEKNPPFYRTVLHTDPKRPYAELHLVAMDMRQLELGIRAGHEEPEPDLGPPGSGHLPEDVAPRVIATFNGAFKASHGRFGMKEDHRVLVAPVQGAATVFIDKNNSVGFGTWDADLAKRSLHSYRQNLDPLIAEGKVNPANRKVWGDHLYGTGVAVERSALCLHHTGQLIYAWATEATGATLAEGLALSGCVYALHLDMNPGHCAFLFNEVTSIDPVKARGEPLDLRMKVNENRYVRWSPKDFFYVARRAPLPRTTGISWSPAPGTRPEPADIPATFIGRKSVGGIEIELERIDSRRFAFRLLAGTAESPKKANSSLEDEAPSQALFAFGLGHSTRGFRTGLTINRKVIVPLSRNYASLTLRKNEAPRLLPPGEPLTEIDGLQVVQLPLLARDRELLAVARELGGNELRSALCVDSSGNLYVGRIKHDTIAPLVQTLLDQGCETVASLDRGSHTPPTSLRAGTETPLRRETEQSLLLGFEIPMTPPTVLH